MSRAVLLLGAPMCFIIQARPVKLWVKEMLYILLGDPPSIILSLLPAPQQACLSLSDEDALRLIYGNDAPARKVEFEREEVEDDDADALKLYDAQEDESGNESSEESSEDEN